MAALTTEKNTPISLEVRGPLPAPVAAATKIWQGSLMMLNASGQAVPATLTTGLTHFGIAKQTYDNSLGLAGDITAEAIQGAGPFVNSGSDTITQADAGKPVYAEDDQTVGHTSTGKSIAGTFLYFDDAGNPVVYAGAI